MEIVVQPSKNGRYKYLLLFITTMHDILDVITSRRSIKRFLPKFMDWEKLSRILDAARHAPSSGNLQNWKFILIMDPEKKQKIAEAAYEQYDMALAAALIVVCGESEKAERYYGEQGSTYTIENCAAAVQNMLLEAQSLGLGSLWVGAFSGDDVRTGCGIPEGVQPRAIVAIGYAAEVPEKPPKYPLENLLYFGSWRNKLKDPAKYMVDIASILERRAQNVKEMAQETVKTVAKTTEKLVKREK